MSDNLRHLQIRRFAFLLAWVALVPGCKTEPPANPNFVVVLVDQLRKDAVHRWMPQINALSAKGIRFEGMRSAAPWTYPSVISMFSGLYPQQHGANGDQHGEGMLTTFDPDIPLLQELLQETHYTAGFVTSPFLQDWNSFDEGFDHFASEEFIGSQGPLRGYPDAVWSNTMFADTVNPSITRHFDQHPHTRPEFVYVHYIDVHGGKANPRSQAGRWEEAPFKVRNGSYRGYADASAYIDEKIIEIYEYFLDRYDGNLVFIVTSDHGQEMPNDVQTGEGRFLRRRKATVHDFNTHIPFIILPSDQIDDDLVITTATSNIDIFPTLLEWAGIAVPNNYPSMSLLAAIKGKPHALPDDRPTYSLNNAFGWHGDGLVLGDTKYIRQMNPDTGQVISRASFNLENDPRESTLLKGDFAEEEKLLEELAGTHGIVYSSTMKEPDDDVMERLKSLGYFVDGAK